MNDLQFENEQLHSYTDYLENKLKNIRMFLEQGVTYQQQAFELNCSIENRKHLSFLQDALSIVQDNHEIPQAQPLLKSMRDLDLDRKPSPRRVEHLKKQASDNFYTKFHRK
tara:strand:- start:752 stop:1084 length:333 start_codon:yes stop_codon:yes gene_type:complete